MTPPPEPQPDLLALLRSVRATRWFTDDAVTEAEIAAIVEAARWTGSARNRQPWRLLIATDAAVRARLGGLGAYAGHLAAAPVVVALAVDRDLGGADASFDEGRLCQTIVLAAHALGLGSCPATIFPEDNVRAAADLLGVGPPWRVEHAIALGRPAPRPPRVTAVPTGRRAADEFAGPPRPTP
ncbi:nitroreductase [Murinocardiopsis flavida]|uniref:Nitroreductase n=1 Tax=Murinocardiopsis flavida TaxID=645275 RepID=A0A2P8DGX8_9ACTN|nr:nitroreductase family protein [Murinocardiopsis flavida]PSK96461.1 nitroreductase [Murinocardiopsis flavida]